MADVALPQLGETVTEGTVTRWFKKIGDHVRADEALFEVSTDKVDTEVPSPVAGTLLEIRVGEGETVPVGTVVAVVGAEHPAAPDTASTPDTAPAPDTAPVPEATAPADLRLVTTPKPGADLASSSIPAPLAAPAPGPEPEPAWSDARPGRPQQSTEGAPRAMRCSRVEVDYTAVDAALRAARDPSPGRGACVLRAVIDALAGFPQVNGSTGTRARRALDLGYAVTVDGVRTLYPVLRGADALRLRAIDTQLSALAFRAANRDITPDELRGATFVFADGTAGALVEHPLELGPGQPAGLSAGAVLGRSAVIDSGSGPALAVRSTGVLNLVWDPQVLDRAVVDGFLTRVKDLIETRTWSQEL